MKKLSAEHKADLNRLAEALAKSHASLQNEIENYNSIVGEISTFAEAINDLQSDYFNEKSDAWQEGDAGQAYQAWMDKFSETPNEVDELDDSNQETIEGFVDSPEEV